MLIGLEQKTGEEEKSSMRRLFPPSRSSSPTLPPSPIFIRFG